MLVRDLRGHRSADEGMRPGQELHERLKVRLRALVGHAEQEAQLRWQTYDDLEMLYLHYADPRPHSDDEEPTNPHKRSIVVPATYAAVQAAVSHIFAAWTSRSVLLPLQAIPREHDRAAEALEAVLEAKHIADFTAIKVWGWLLDAWKYGQGRLVSAWETEHEEVEETVEVPLPGLLGLLAPPQQVTRVVQRLRREGPANRNIPARDYLPDPSAPGWDPQAGQFVAIKSRRSRGSLWQMQSEGAYFNVQWVPGSGEGRAVSEGREQAYGQVALSQERAPLDTDDLDMVDLITVYVRLIPKLWELGAKTMPEIWVFTLANGDVIVRAEPQQSRHGMFPVAVVDSNLDVHALYSPSAIEVTKGLQEHMDFLYNARQANIRLGLYMAFLYDPRYVEEEDIYSAQPGLRVRLRADAFGSQPRSLSEVFHQVPVQDVTRTVLQDIELQQMMIQRALGAPDVLQGLPAKAQRSATEMGGVIEHARNRVGQMGALMWGQGMVRLGQIEISDTQQFLSEEGYYRLSGEAARRWEGVNPGDPRVLVGPRMVQGQVQVEPVDVTMPVHREQLGMMWMKLAMGVASNPVLSQKYSADEMFEEAARLLGAKNIDDFKQRAATPAQVQVMPDDQVRAAVEKGDLAPVGAPGQMGGGAGGGDEALMALMQAGFGGGVM